MGEYRRKSLCAIAVLHGLGVGVGAAPAEGQDLTATPTTTGDIIVYGPNGPIRTPGGMRADAELDENGIAAYGLDTVGDLLAEILPQVDTSDAGPVVLVNGRPSNGINEISDLPTEAVSRVQLLPRQAAGQLGQNPTRRVVNIVIKPDLRQFTANGTAGLATAGKGFSAEGELSLLSLAGGNRRSLVLKAKHADPLYEGDRDILGDGSIVPFDLVGNIVPYPTGADEIDPALSALAGRLVSIAGVPAGNTAPTLAAFAARAGDANVSDLGRYRTLLPRQRSYSANANLTQKLGANSTLSLNMKAERNEADGLTGATAAQLILPSTSPYSPFGTDVTLARYIGGPLRQRSRGTNLSFAGILNTLVGRWRVSLNSNVSHGITHVDSERGIDTSALQAGLLSGAVNPFAPLPANLVSTLPRDNARSRVDHGSTLLIVTGSPFQLPAGPANAALRVEWRADRNATQTMGAGSPFFSRLHRDEEIAQLSLQMPLLGGALPSPIGAVGVELSGALRHVTASGRLEDYGYGLNWQPGSAWNFRAVINQEQIAPPTNALTDAVVTIDNVRTYDFIRQETVFVRYITGGNPDLAVERRRTTRISGNWRPFAARDLSINAEYSRIIGTNAFSALPPVNAQVQAAFPDRFLRDGGGRLIGVDARPVPFARVKREQLRWGVTFSQSFGSGTTPSGKAGTGGAGRSLAAGWRINGFLNDLWTLSSTRLARPGLADIDLLAGGALGYGGGQPRHLVQFGGGVLRNGVGVQVDGAWKSSTNIAAGTVAVPDKIVFAPQAVIGLRLFANLGPLLPRSALAKGFRISLSVENLFDSKQRVVDRTGTTPLGYQPYLLDPLGRTVSLSLRKVF